VTLPVLDLIKPLKCIKLQRTVHGEPMIKPAPSKTTVVYNHNTLNTNPPFKKKKSFFFVILHRAKVGGFQSTSRQSFYLIIPKSA
jgi:hypothetical protein